jgi:carboxypeptidase C (cathepsin A)
MTDLTAMAATAWYHGKAGERSASVEAAMAAARTFAADDYLKALNAGHLLPTAERQRIAARLATLTGVPAQTWLAANLRLSMSAFQSQLLGDVGQTVGAYDSRYTLPTRPAGNDPVIDDPAMGQYTPGFVAAMNHYVAAELGVRTQERYIPINWNEVNFRWDYGSGPGVTVPRNDATELATAMRRNPGLRAFVVAGYYDLVTTLGAAEYALAHAAVARDRLVLKGYPSGHMPYLGEDSATALAADLRLFLRGGLPAQAKSETSSTP